MLHRNCQAKRQGFPAFFGEKNKSFEKKKGILKNCLKFGAECDTMYKEFPKKEELRHAEKKRGAVVALYRQVVPEVLKTYPQIKEYSVAVSYNSVFDDAAIQLDLVFS